VQPGDRVETAISGADCIIVPETPNEASVGERGCPARSIGQEVRRHSTMVPYHGVSALVRVNSGSSISVPGHGAHRERRTGVCTTTTCPGGDCFS
jgi:hypothetical protein